MFREQLMYVVVFAVVVLCWLILLSFLALRKKAPEVTEHKRDRKWILGIALQGVSFALPWSLQRAFFSPIAPMAWPFELAFALLTVALAVASVWFSVAAVRALGKQWGLAARLINEHKLITQGPYRLVRHPIYTSMLGMLLATALAVSRPIALIPAVALCIFGTMIRVRSEERLLREAFGAEFEAYARSVPAIIPRLH